MKMAKYKIKLLDEFESRTDEWGFRDVEKRLSELRKNTSYHDMKGIINDAHKLGLWPETVKRYLITNHASFGNVSGELTDTFNSIYPNLTDTEKAIAKIK